MSRSQLMKLFEFDVDGKLANYIKPDDVCAVYFLTNTEEILSIEKIS